MEPEQQHFQHEHHLPNLHLITNHVFFPRLFLPVLSTFLFFGVVFCVAGAFSRYVRFPKGNKNHSYLLPTGKITGHESHVKHHSGLFKQKSSQQKNVISLHHWPVTDGPPLIRTRAPVDSRPRNRTPHHHQRLVLGIWATKKNTHWGLERYIRGWNITQFCGGI